MQINQQDRKTDKERLFSRIRNEKVTLFIGSGFSYGAGAPTANAITDAIKRDCAEIQKTELKDVAEEYVQRNDDNKNKLINLVQSLFPTQAKCDDNQRALTRLPHIKQIFTTNYDSYIEDAYADKCHVIREEKDLAECNDNVVQIYKLHGDFVNKDAVVITNEDYNDFFDHKKNSLIWAPLKLAMMHSHVLFIGYSLDDSNVFRILQNIEKIFGTSPREMYMISPSTEDYKADRLRKHNVKWIQSTAETFLKELEQNIEDNIFDDYRKKAVSHRTFIEFCHFHDINPDIRENEQSNEVVSLQGYAGKSLNRQISVRATYDPLSNFDLEKTGPIKIPGLKDEIYAIKVPKTEMLSFESRANGLKELGLENITNFYIVPLPETQRVNIRIPSRNFIGGIDCKKQRTGTKQVTCTFDFDICVFKLIINLEHYHEDGLMNIHVQTQMNDVYKSQENALHWIEVIDAIYSGETVIFTELPGVQIHIADVDDYPKGIYKEYYTFIREIELKGNVSFSKYNNYTPQRFEQAKRLAYWFNEQILSYELVPNNRDMVFTIDIVDSDCELVKAKKSNKWALALNRETKPFDFNGYTFCIPYDYVLYGDCSVIKKEPLQNNMIRLTLRNNNGSYQEILSSSPKFGDESEMDVIMADVK